MKRAQPSTSSKKAPKLRSPGLTQCPAELESLPGEDSVSFGRHNRLLQVEFKKARRNEELVSDLMDKTYVFRRRAILKSTPDLKSLFSDYPFLQDANQVLRY